jgi:hypothetical protein
MQTPPHATTALEFESCTFLLPEEPMTQPPNSSCTACSLAIAPSATYHSCIVHWEAPGSTPGLDSDPVTWFFDESSGLLGAQGRPGSRPC